MKFVRFILNYASLHFILIFLYQTLRWWYFNVSTSLACAVHHELTLLRARVFWVSTSFRPHLGDQKLLINGRNFLEFSRSWLADRQMSVTIVSSLVIRMCDPVCYARSTRCVRVWGGLRLVYFCTKRMIYLLILHRPRIRCVHPSILSMLCLWSVHYRYMPYTLVYTHICIWWTYISCHCVDRVNHDIYIIHTYYILTYCLRVPNDVTQFIRKWLTKGRNFMTMCWKSWRVCTIPDTCFRCSNCTKCGSSASKTSSNKISCLLTSIAIVRLVFCFLFLGEIRRRV